MLVCDGAERPARRRSARSGRRRIRCKPALSISCGTRSKYASKRDRAQIAKHLKPVYTAASESEALDRCAEFSGKWEKRYPAIIRLWENAWAEFVRIPSPSDR